MAMIEDLRRILSIKIRSRHDLLFDQYSRLFMPKLILLSAVAMGVNWYHDKLSCIIRDDVKIPHTFISDACWVNGFYVFPALSTTMTSYYAIPDDVTKNGQYAKNGKLCRVDEYRDPDCVGMKKMFFLQYQWYPFFVAALMLVFYLPHVAFKVVNVDIITLKNAIKQQSPDEIAVTYFNPRVNTAIRMRWKIFANTLVKLAYLFGHVITFALIDHTLNNGFKRYANAWLEWGGGDNTHMFEYSEHRMSFRAGEQLLPTFGLCEVQEGARDNVEARQNSHTFVCEYSAHVLYHYVLLLLWFALVAGVIFSSLGLLFHLVKHVLTFLPCNKNNPQDQMHVLKSMSLREQEYMYYIRTKNIALYGVLLDLLRKQQIHGKFEREDPVEELRSEVQDLRRQVACLLKRESIIGNIKYNNVC